jgi:hypothetical protein
MLWFLARKKPRLQIVYKPIKCQQLLTKLTLWFVHLDPWRRLIGQTSHSRSKPEWAGWVPCIVKPCTSGIALVLLLSYYSIVWDSPARLSFYRNLCLVSTKFGPKCVMCLINKLRIKLLNVRPNSVRCTICIAHVLRLTAGSFLFHQGMA